MQQLDAITNYIYKIARNAFGLSIDRDKVSVSRPVAVCANQNGLPVLRTQDFDLNSEILITCFCLWCKLLWRSSFGTKYIC